MISILYLEDNQMDVDLIESHFDTEGLSFKLDHVKNQDQFIRYIQKNNYDIVLCDYAIPGFDGISAMKLAKEMQPLTPVIILSGTLGEEAAVETLKKGATDYVLKDNLPRLVPSLKRALNEAEALKNKIEAERALVKNEKKYRSLFEYSNDAVILIDKKKIILDVNEMAVKLTNVPKNQMIGSHIEGFFKNGHPNMESLTEAIKQTASGGHYRFETEFHNNNNSIVYLDINLSVYEPETCKIQLVVRDVSEIKDIIANQENLIQVLEEKISELEQFNYITSHDLKTPLFTIKGFINLIRQDIAEKKWEQAKTDMLTVEKAVDTMSDLLEALLEIAKVGRDACVFKNINTNEMLGNVLQLLLHDIKGNNVQVKYPANLPDIYGDEIRIREAFINLIQNAIKFSNHEKRPSVEIDGHSFEDEIVFYIKDNGIGISTEYHEKIFGLFNRLDPDIEGSGIGLTLVKKVIEKHGGRIWLESDGPGKGACFFLSFPHKNQLEVNTNE